MINKLLGNEYKFLVKKRERNSHKGSFGFLGLVCGSQCYQGAATFATSAALHCGVGIAVAFIPECIYTPFASKISGAVIEPLASSGGMSCDKDIAKKILSRKCTALLCGSGIGISQSSFDTVRRVSGVDLPLVVDGDGLFVFSRDKSLFERNNVTVITPHIGEFSKLCEKTVRDVRKNRIRYALDFASKYNCTVVLKDYVTVIAEPCGEAFVLSKPTSALSKGGSGDVLAGMLSSFLAQGMTAKDAAISAVTLHNSCGLYCEKHYGSYFTQPENIINSISSFLR